MLSASSGPDALHQARRYQGAIDMLLTDVIMPAMSGPEFAGRFAVDRPNSAVLYMSGFAEGLTDDRGVLPPDTALLSKPFTREQLLTAVRSSIEAHQSR